MRISQPCHGAILAGAWLVVLASAVGAEDWSQLKFDARRSGNVPERQVATPLGLVAAIPLTDAVLAAPICSGGRVYAVDASGVAFCIDAQSLKILWQTPTPGGPANCSNISSPALAGGFLHFGTTGGRYFVLDARDGSIVRQIACGEPIFSAPAVAGDRLLTLAVYAVEPDGTVLDLGLRS